MNMNINMIPPLCNKKCLAGPACPPVVRRTMHGTMATVQILLLLLLLGRGSEDAAASRWPPASRWRSIGEGPCCCCCCCVQMLTIH